MGYLSMGKPKALFVRLSDEDIPEVNRLINIGKRTKSKRIKKKIAKRVDNLVKVD